MPSRLVSHFPAILLTGFLFALCSCNRPTVQETVPTPPDDPAPTLAVLVYFDQLRGDFLQRWEPLFVEGGFRRLLQEGADFRDCHYPYAFTLTGPGHATVAAGCTPATNGIIANDWFSRAADAEVNCVSDERYSQVPPAIVAKGKKAKTVAPTRLRAETIADALRKATGGKAVIVTLSIKDRSAVLPGGQRPTACYWFDSHGRVVTSTYYRDRLHPWAQALNDSGYGQRWLGTMWLRLRPEIDYVRWSGFDDIRGEGTGSHQGRTFPHPIGTGPKAAMTNYHEAVANSPFGNEFLLELTKRAIEGEKLGTRAVPDLLTISFSSNDLVGHIWGPDSQEVLDTTLRSDLIMKELLETLDARVGKGRYVLALTADHGICPLPEVARSQGKDGGRVLGKDLGEKAEAFLNKTYPPEKEDAKVKQWIRASLSNMMYLDQKAIARRGLKSEDVAASLAKWVATQPGFQSAYTRDQILNARSDDPIAAQMRLSFYAQESGDVMLVLKPGWFISSSTTGTTHGSPHPYDTHVPLLVYGTGVQPGVRRERVSPELAAVALARGLRIPPPAQARVTVPTNLFGRMD